MSFQVFATFLLIVTTAYSIGGPSKEDAIDGSPELFCEPNSMSIVFRSHKPFTGRTFVKGYVFHSECAQYGNGGVNHRFTIQFDQCGIRRYREYNGISVATTIIISFHKLFITKVDRAYHLRCFYLEASKTLSQHMDVSMITTVELARQTELPICRYEILMGGPTGTPIRFVRVGDTVYHRWSCTSEVGNLYCMKVHSCIVYDGQGGQSVELIDKDGCAVEPGVLADLEYLGDLVSGQRASVFKFADRSALYFSCQIELLIRDPYVKCSAARPRCNPQMIVTAASEEEDSALEEEYSAPMLSASPEDQVGDFPPDLRDAPLSGSKRIIGRKTLSARLNNKPYNRNQNSLVQGTTIPGIESVSYSRLLRVKRNITNERLRKDVSKELRRVANVDLPEQSLTVFGIENDHLPTKSELSNVANELGSKSNVGEVCSSTSRMTVISIVLAALLCSALTALLIIIQRQRDRFEKVYYK